MTQKLLKMCLALTMILSMLNIQPLKAVSYGNVALNKTVSASSTHSSKTITHAVDGKVVDKQTWQINYVTGSDYSRGNGDLVEDFTIDLGETYYINKIDITWTATVWAKYVKVEGSLDGTDYFTITEVTNNSISADKEKQEIEFDLTTTRFVKLTFDQPNNKTYGYEFYEVEVFGSDQVEGNVSLKSLFETIKNVPPTISADGTSLVLPKLEEDGYDVVLYGSSNESVIGLDGTIYQPLEDKVVNVSYKVVNVDDSEQCYFNDYDEVAITIPGLYNKEDVDNEKPTVLPEISEWKGVTGTFTLADDAKLVIADESLRETVELVQYYFNEMLDREIEVVVGTPSTGDIYFELGDKKELGKEGYMAMIADQVNVLAYDKKGLQYAGATLVQILSQDENHVSLPKGLMRDYPAFAVRSMMIDVGRYYIPLDYMEEIGKYMSYFKMSEFHVHLNDNGGEQSYGFRLQSEKYPQINSNLNPEHVYTKEAYKAFQKEVMRFGIDVITEIDTPAHSGFLNLYDKSFLLNDRHIDLSNPEVISFIKSLFDEYLDGDDPVIQSNNFHIGVDEYPVAHSDLARQYCDELIKYVNAKGYNTRMWGAFGSSSGLAGSYEVTTDVICNYWSPNYSDPKQMIEDGYAAINNNRTYLYEVPSSDLDRNKFSVKQGWENWNVINVPGVTLSNSTPMLHGAESAFWYDNEAGYSEFDSWEVLKGMALLIAEKAWVGKDDEKTAKEFEDTIDLLGDYAPGSNPSRYVETKTEEIVCYDFEDVEANVVKDMSENAYDAILNDVEIVEENGNKVLALNGAGYMSLPFEAKGLNYTVGFDLTLTENPVANAVLFNGEAADGTFYLNYEGKEETAFVRKDYVFKFDFNFEKGKAYKVVLTSDTNDTTLYVNGVLVSKAVAQVNAARKTTFVLPTAEIGSGVVGSLDNFVLLNRALSYDELLGFEEKVVENLALNKPTTVSGLETDDGRFTSDLAVDGDTSSRVSFEKKDDAWFIVDLEDTYWVESIEIDFGELPSGFQLYVSEDGNEWTMIHEDTACEGGAASIFSKELLAGVKARYVKYQQLGMFTASNGRNYSGNFNEFRVWGAKENVVQNILAEAKEILNRSGVTEANEAFLEQLQNSVSLIEAGLETSEEVKLASILLMAEINKFNTETFSQVKSDKTQLNELLNNKLMEDASNESLYEYYYKQGIKTLINSDATQAEVDEVVYELETIVYTVNLALNGDIISYNGLNPGRINDGEKPARGNYWDSDGDAQDSSIVVKLIQPAYLDRIVVIPYYYRSDYYYNYEVLVSADNENWTTLATYTDKTGKYSVAGQTFTFEQPMLVEYVKIQGIESNNSNKIHITELEAYAKVLPGANKAKLRAAIEAAEAFDTSLLQDESANALETMIAEAKAIYDDADATQEVVDATVVALNESITNVIYKTADYSKVFEAIETATNIESGMVKNYQLLSDALNAVVLDKDIRDQASVDAMAKAITDAIAALEYYPAIYTSVNEAIELANSIDESLCTNFDDVTAAVNAVVEGKDIRYQAEVNAMAKAIYDAINALEYKPADYTSVNEAIAAVNALNKDEYTNFDDVTAAVNAVVEGKDIRYQASVDAMADAIYAAMNALVKKVVAPAKVENVVAEDTNYKTITLTWDASETATAYEVYRKAYDSEEFKLYKTVEDTTLEVSGVMTGKEYAFYVVAKNEAGAAEASETVAKATTLHGEVTLAVEKVSTSTFKLSWNAIDGATRYIVYRKRNDDKMKKVLTLGADKLEYVTAEMPNGEYQFILKAGRYDSKDRVMTDASNTVKGSEETLRPTVTLKAGTKSIKVSWKKMEGVTHYQVYRAASKDGKYTKLITTKELSYTAKSLSSGKKYFFKVRGYKQYKSGTDIKYVVYTPYSTIKYATVK